MRFSFHQAGMFAVCSLLAFATVPILAEPGQIIISRDVAPRVATRPALVPDPNPQTVNPAASTMGATAELSDGDFASVATGLAQPRLVNGNPVPTSTNPPDGLIPHHVPGMGASRGNQGSDGGISAQVNRPLQQGLRPLQM
ncbi:hypothetical protein [Pseudomonas sp.]|uniref:hypothetical protein n=1 Tax=Pseudomonas sp. TaxID=306 RepID=UPI00272BA94A|nr:hypothetical protein [Pseudomonas sp.]